MIRGTVLYIGEEDWAENESTASTVFDDQKYIELHKRCLPAIPLYSWIRYYRPDDNKFVIGGFLIVNAYPTYLVLKSGTGDITWSVNLSRLNGFVIHRSRWNRLTSHPPTRQTILSLLAGA